MVNTLATPILGSPSLIQHCVSSSSSSLSDVVLKRAWSLKNWRFCGRRWFLFDVRVEFGILQINHHYLQTFHIFSFLSLSNFRVKKPSCWTTNLHGLRFEAALNTTTTVTLPWSHEAVTVTGGVLGGSFFSWRFGGGNSKIYLFSPRNLGKVNPIWWLNFFKGVGTNHQPDSVILWDLNF